VNGDFYKENIIASSTASGSRLKQSIHGYTTFVEATQFRYLIASVSDYLDLLESDSPLQVKFFGGSAFIEQKGAKISIVSAAQYFRECLPDSHFPHSLKAKFACYIQGAPERIELPLTLHLTAMEVNAEDLLVDRTLLLSLIDSDEEVEKEKDELLPPEITEHLQPWKSEFLRAMNISAYNIYSSNKKNKTSKSIVKTTDIKEDLKNQLSENTQSDTKVSLAATLLRHEHSNLIPNKYLSKRDTNNYPNYFSIKLIYLNEKCKEYHDEYSTGESPHTATSINSELDEDNIIPKNTARRIASEIKPIYEKIKLFKQ
jgi:hypothetical protein